MERIQIQRKSKRKRKQKRKRGNLREGREAPPPPVASPVAFLFSFFVLTCVEFEFSDSTLRHYQGPIRLTLQEIRDPTEIIRHPTIIKAPRVILMARVIIKGKDFGPHPFFFQVRDWETHESLLGMLYSREPE